MNKSESIVNGFRKTNNFQEIAKGIINSERIDSSKFDIFSKHQISSYLKDKIEKNVGLSKELQKSVTSETKQELNKLLPINIKKGNKSELFFISDKGVCKELLKAFEPVNKDKDYFNNDFDEEEVLQFIKDNNPDDDALIEKFGENIIDFLNKLEEDNKIEISDENTYKVKDLGNVDKLSGEEIDFEKDSKDNSEEDDKKNSEEDDDFKEDENSKDNNLDKNDEDDLEEDKNSEDINDSNEDEEEDLDNEENNDSAEDNDELNNLDSNKEDNLNQKDANIFDNDKKSNEANEKDDLNDSSNNLDNSNDNSNDDDVNEEKSDSNLSNEELEAMAKKTASATLLKFYKNSNDENLKEIAKIELKSRNIEVEDDDKQNNSDENLPQDKEDYKELENYVNNYLGGYDKEDLVNLVAELANKYPKKRAELKEAYRRYYSMNNNGNKALKIEEDDFKNFLENNYFNNFTQGDLQSMAFLLISKLPKEYKKFKNMYKEEQEMPK